MEKNYQLSKGSPLQNSVKALPAYLGRSDSKSLLKSSSDIVSFNKYGNSGISRVGTNFVGIVPKPSEFTEQENYNTMKNRGVDESFRGPGSYMPVNDWSLAQRKKTFNLKIIK